MHFHLPKPLHGWRQFVGEVGIIVLGVLIALGAEQLVESWTTHLRVEEGRQRIRIELGHAFEVAEERNDVRPCIDEQLTKIEQAVLSSGNVMKPLPVYSEMRAPQVALVLRTPSARILPEADLQSFIAEGLSTHLSPRERTWLPALYTLMMRASGETSDELAAAGDLTALSQPLPLDPQVKSSFVREIEQERVRNGSLDRLSTTLMQWVRETGDVPDNDARQRWLEHSPTMQFCKAHGFSLATLTGN